MLSDVSESHRCYAQSPARQPDDDWQLRFCLKPDHLACRFYAEPVLADDGAENQTEFRAHAIKKLGRPNRGWAPVFGLVLITVLGIAIVLSNLVGTPILSFDRAGATIEPALDLEARPATATPPLEASGNITTVIALGPTEAPTPQKRSLIPTPTPRVGVEQLMRPTANLTGERATPAADSTLHTLRPDGAEVGWWRSNAERRNYLGDSFLYAGSDEQGETYISAARFDLSDIPRGAAIEDVTLHLTGLRGDQLDADTQGRWLLQLLPETSLTTLAESDFLTLYSAPASIILDPQITVEKLAVGETNSWTLDETARGWLAQQLLDGAQSIYLRIQATSDGAGFFAWDSGTGPESQGNPPQLVLNVGPPPPTPPPLPTREVIVATLTPIPDNVVTVVAQAATATAVAETTGTYTPPAYAIVTPTPFPANLATVQAVAVAKDLAPVALNTPAPPNAAAATADAAYATAVAVTTGTFTPVPTNYVTPVLILPSPPAENVATEAARVVQATAYAASGAAGTPLPHNAVIAEYVYATPAPENEATAAAMAVIAAANVQVQGTPTPLPWNAVVITAVPTPLPATSTPLPLVLEPTPTEVPKTPTPLPEGLPADVYGKIIFLSDRTGSTAPHLLDPVSGDVRLITQAWVYDRAREQLGLSPDGRQVAIVEADISRPKLDGGHVLQIKLRSLEFGDTRQISACTNDCYDPAWSPAGDRVAYVGMDLKDEEIFVTGVDGQSTLQLTFNDWESEKHPTWSPDGSRLVFFSNRTGKNQLWSMNADGSNAQNLSNNEYNDWNPIWVRSP
jgi:hypothetical protein